MEYVWFTIEAFFKGFFLAPEEFQLVSEGLSSSPRGGFSNRLRSLCVHLPLKNFSNSEIFGFARPFTSWETPKSSWSGASEVKYSNQTKHFVTRTQQRCISENVVNLVIRYGVTKRHKGADVTFLDKKGREKLKKSWSNNPKDLERAQKVHLVEIDGRFITAFYKTKHMKRDCWLFDRRTDRVIASAEGQIRIGKNDIKSDNKC